MFAGSVVPFSAAVGSPLAASGICTAGTGATVDAHLGTAASPSAFCRTETAGATAGFFVVPVAVNYSVPLALTVSKSGSSASTLGRFRVRPAAVAANLSAAALPDALTALRAKLNAASSSPLSTFFANCFESASSAQGAHAPCRVHPFLIASRL